MWGSSGKYLIIMTYWWIVPFFIIGLISFPLRQYIDSYYPFFIAFIITIIIGFICGALEGRYDYWHRSGYWKKYFIINGIYLLNIIFILIITLILDCFHFIKYFGGDAAGSFGMLYIPSVIFYLLFGLIVGWLRRLRVVNKT